MAMIVKELRRWVETVGVHILGCKPLQFALFQQSHEVIHGATGVHILLATWHFCLNPVCGCDELARHKMLLAFIAHSQKPTNLPITCDPFGDVGGFQVVTETAQSDELPCLTGAGFVQCAHVGDGVHLVELHNDIDLLDVCDS